MPSSPRSEGAVHFQPVDAPERHFVVQVDGVAES